MYLTDFGECWPKNYNMMIKFQNDITYLKFGLQEAMK